MLQEKELRHLISHFRVPESYQRKTSTKNKPNLPIVRQTIQNLGITYSCIYTFKAEDYGDKYISTPMEL
jgi:hypothetical protein